MKQTAVEWIGKELESYGDSQFCKIEWEQLDSLIKQAKEMEKEQIIKAFNQGNIYEGNFFDRVNISAEQYYNENYNI